MTDLLVCIDLPIRWSDLDAFNHVNNARYLTYVEEARLVWMQGLPGRWEDAEAVPLLAAMQMNYRRPALWPGTVRIELGCQRIGNSSLTLTQRIVDANAPDTLYADGHCVMVWVERENGRPTALPANVRDSAEAVLRSVAV